MLKNQRNFGCECDFGLRQVWRLLAGILRLFSVGYSAADDLVYKLFRCMSKNYFTLENVVTFSSDWPDLNDRLFEIFGWKEKGYS